MAVRFLPPTGAGEPAPERGDLAEVIDLRTRLAGPAQESDEIAELRAEVRRIENAPPETRTSVQAPVDGNAESDIAEPTGQEDAPPLRSAAEDGVRMLARKARSAGELRRELLRLGHEVREVEAALLEFESSLYLDDLGLARTVADGLRERKRASRMQIRMKLRERLLPDGVIEEVLGELDEDEEYELLRVAAEDRARRLTDLDRQTAERRLLGFLARRGWSGERASRAAREALDAHTSRSGVRFR